VARRLYKRLTVATVKKLAAQPGMHADGDGLYLNVGRRVVDGEITAEAPSWIWRFWDGQHQREMGLGALRRVSLAEARGLAAAARQLRESGADPIEVRREAKRAGSSGAIKQKTFKECALAYLDAQGARWRSPVHARQWVMSLEQHVYPAFGALSVAAIDTTLVFEVLQPLWRKTPETGTRVRGRIEKILGWAMTAGHRPKGDNPARWKDHLEHLLAPPADAKAAVREAAGRGEHHEALPYAELGAFVSELRQLDSVAARALEFAILTVGRTAEVIGATWSEVNLAEKTWIVPPERMKGKKKEHRVPLSDAAMAILERMSTIRGGDFIFPGADAGKPLSGRAMFLLLNRTMRRPGTTIHGFRSSFSDWCTEQTSFSTEARELALAHTIGNKVEAAYRRGDLFERRRQLAEAWARHCASVPAATAAGGKIVAIGSR
jgi:integrase